MCVFVLMHMYITEPRPSTSQLQQARSVHHASQSITKELYCTLHGHTFRPRPGFVEHGPRRPWTTSTTSRAAPPSSDHVDHELRRPRPERLRRALTTSTTRPRRNDDRREERRYDNRDHHHNSRKARGPDNFITTDQMSIQI